MGDHLGVGLAAKDVALGLQGGTQFVVVFNDAVVHQGNSPRALRGIISRIDARAVTEMRMGVVYRWRAMRGPAGMRDARATR